MAQIHYPGIDLRRYGSERQDAWVASEKKYKPSVQIYAEEKGAFMLGCRMSQAPRDMTTLGQFEKNTGMDHVQYKEFCNGMAFDADLRKQLAVSTTNP